MAGHGIGRLTLAATLTLGLAGCEDGANPFAGKPAADGGAVAVRAPAGGPTGSRDVEAPEAFSMTGEGLWDGRPSLGGIWVAHASVTNPERVLIRNPKNGKSVVGALFRRERLNPGPSIQISSDAADALGLLAGQPAGLSIVALRREDLPAPAAAAEEAPPAGASAVTAAAAGAAATRPPAKPAANAANAAPSATAPAVDPIAASAAAAIAKAEGGAEAAATGAEPAAEAAVPAPTWAEKRAQRRAERQAAREARAAERAAAEAAAAEPAVTVTVTPGPGAAGGGAAAGAVSSSVLPAAGAAAAGAAAAPPAPAETLLRAYVQIGIFSTEANAVTAAAQLKATGLTATLREDVIDGKPYWRVIVGPAASVAERDALAARVKAIGYPDAYPVQN